MFPNILTHLKGIVYLKEIKYMYNAVQLKSLRNLRFEILASVNIKTSLLEYDDM